LENTGHLNGVSVGARFLTHPVDNRGAEVIAPKDKFGAVQTARKRVALGGGEGKCNGHVILSLVTVANIYRR
jgi:hypothetical protein